MCCPSAQANQAASVGSDPMGKYEPMSGVDVGYSKGKYHIKLVHSVLTLRTKAIDYFCLAADDNEDLPPLKNKAWADYRLTTVEWKQVKLVHHCLKVWIVISIIFTLIIVFIKLVAKRHNELSKEDTPTCNRQYPTLEMLMSDWEELLENKEFEPVHAALCAGIALLEKYYSRADDTNAYFISHSKSSPH